jgi:hypothetical protein
VAARRNAPRREEDVDAGAASKVKDRLARPKLREQRRVAAPQALLGGEPDRGQLLAGVTLAAGAGVLAARATVAAALLAGRHLDRLRLVPLAYGGL